MTDQSSAAPDFFSLERHRHPVRLDLELSESTMAKLKQLSAETGRDVDELILEILDQSLDGH